MKTKTVAIRVELDQALPDRLAWEPPQQILVAIRVEVDQALPVWRSVKKEIEVLSRNPC